MCTRSQSSRDVDQIDVMLHIVPTLYVDTLRKQASDIGEKVDNRKRKRKNRDTGLSTDVALTMTEGACQATIKLSRICKITQKIAVTEIEVNERENDDWHRFLFDAIEEKAFNINQHYLAHIPYIIRNIGPLRHFSTRPMERTVVKLQGNIKSTSKVAENVVNVLKDYFAKKSRAWNRYDDDNVETNSSELPLYILEELYPDANVIAFFKCIYDTVEKDGSVRIISEYSKLKNGQRLKTQRSKKISVVIENREEERQTDKEYCSFRIATIKKMFDLNGDDWCIITLETQLKCAANYGHLQYYSLKDLPPNNNHKILKMKYIVGYAIHLPSLTDENNVYIRWKK